MDRFFNNPREGQNQRVAGLGSGFFISPDGYILTNNHLVGNAMKVIVTDIEENEYTARKIGSDPKTDLALLKIDIKNHSYIQLGDSDKLGVGDWVLAIGNPLGQDLSVTAGIVSAKGRQLSGLDVDYQDYIQTDASINQGNSGGPLIDMSGEAVGINSVILSTSGGNIGLGFAIPSNMAKKVIVDLKKEGRVVRGYVGIQIAEISDADARQYDLPMGGVLVIKVEDDSPGQKAGLKKYDLIIEADGTKVKTTRELRTIIASHNPGDMVKLTCYREKTKKTVEVKVIEQPGSVTINSGDEDGRIIDLGMVVIDNSRALEKQYGLGTSEGVVVSQVERGGIADQNNLQAGDVIVGVNRTPIENVRQFREIISKIIKGKNATGFFLSIFRDEKEIFLKFKIPNKPEDGQEN
jgi:serine protease Do